MKNPKFIQKAGSLTEPAFIMWFEAQPVALQFRAQRVAGFGVGDLEHEAKRKARARQLNLPTTASPAEILYHLYKPGGVGCSCQHPANVGAPGLFGFAAGRNGSPFLLRNRIPEFRPDSASIAGVEKATAEKLDEMNVPEIKVSYRKRRFDTREITSVKAMADLLREVWDADLLDVQESFYALFFTGSGVLLGYYRHTVGTTASVAIDYKILLGAALKSLTGAIIVAHNHPSGILTPSDQDISFSKQLNANCKMLGITLWDSLIITKTGYTSLVERRLI